MTLLIPDARSSLLGGLVDDATLLRTPAPSIDEAVDGYRTLRDTTNGWIVGRFLTPAAMLESLAAVLVRTMTRGEVPWSIAVVFGDHSAGDASMAASFHAAMGPAARVDVIHVPEPSPPTEQGAVDSLVTGTGVQPEALTVLAVDVGGRPTETIDAFAAARTRILHAAGVQLNTDDDGDPSLLAEAIRRCVRDTIPFTIGPSIVPAVTTVDARTGNLRYGALNLLASSLWGPDRTNIDVRAILVDDDPDNFAIGFTGVRWKSATAGPRSMPESPRNPLVSISALDPAAAINAVSTVMAGDRPYLG